MFLATECLRKEKVQHSLAQGGIPSTPENILIGAINTCDLGLVEALLREAAITSCVEADSAEFAWYRMIPLNVAAYLGHWNIIDRLLEAGADPNQTSVVVPVVQRTHANGDGRIALHEAIRGTEIAYYDSNKRYRVINKVISYEADILAKDCTGRTATQIYDKWTSVPVWMSLRRLQDSVTRQAKTEADAKRALHNEKHALAFFMA